MAFVSPQGNVTFYKNAPVDSTYKNVVLFGSTTARDGYYFDYPNKWTVNNISYQRYTRNSIKVELNANEIIDYNYMRFQNVGFDNYFYVYAFITSVDYINNVTCVVTYDIDVFTTFYYMSYITQCYVEREHTNDDTIGANVVAESLELGDMTNNVIQYPNSDINDAFKSTVVIMATFGCGTGKFENSYHGQQNNLYSGIVYNPFGNGGLGSTTFNVTIHVGKSNEETVQIKTAGDFIMYATIDNKANGLLGAFEIPARFGNTTYFNEYGAYSCDYNISKDLYFNYDGYVPKNNKLRTFPYSYLTVYASNGAMKSYRWEDFIGDSCNFKEYLAFNMKLESCLTPQNYQMNGDNFLASMLLSDYPMCPINTDTYSRWLAKNEQVWKISRDYAFAQQGLGLLSDAINVANMPINYANVNSRKKPPIPQIAGDEFTTPINRQLSFDKTINTLNAQQDIMRSTANETIGGSGSALSYATHSNGFTFYRTSVRGEYAKIIDNYFSMYGYATHKIKLPNLTGRKSWNYVKTVGAEVQGSAPSSIQEQLATIFDSGVTLWHSASTFRDYTQDNSIIGE